MQELKFSETRRQNVLCPKLEFIVAAGWVHLPPELLNAAPTAQPFLRAAEERPKDSQRLHRPYCCDLLQWKVSCMKKKCAFEDSILLVVLIVLQYKSHQQKCAYASYYEAI